MSSGLASLLPTRGPRALAPDESGTPQIPGNTSHFILAGICIPIERWKDCDRQIGAIKQRYSLENTELHATWLLRDYQEQRSVPNLNNLAFKRRQVEVGRVRTAELLRLQKKSNPKAYKQAKKNYKHTEPYMHLTRTERRNFAREVASCVSRWKFARLFADCIDKLHFDPTRHPYTLGEVAFEQIVSRFQVFLNITGAEQQNYGLLIHDNNQTVAKQHTELMKSFYRRGTLWTKVDNIIETPLFVDSELTSLVQVADLCAYALKRYLENGDTDLFKFIYYRADRKDGVVVGVRHFTEQPCSCKICVAHRRQPTFAS